MKKRILAATLMASMALAVGYSNGTNVTVTTHEGKVVEAKTVYRPSELFGIYDSLLLLNGTRITNDFSSVHWNLTSIFKDFHAVDTNYGREYNYGQSDVKMNTVSSGNSYKITSIEVTGSNAVIGDNLRIGMKITVNDLKKRITGTPISESNDFLAYNYGDTIVFIYLTNGQLSKVTYYIS